MDSHSELRWRSCWAAQLLSLSVAGCHHCSWVVWWAIVSVDGEVGGPSWVLVVGHHWHWLGVVGPHCQSCHYMLHMCSLHSHCHVIVCSSPVLAVWLSSPIIVVKFLLSVVISHRCPLLLCHRQLLSSLYCAVVVVVSCCQLLVAQVSWVGTGVLADGWQTTNLSFV